MGVVFTKEQQQVIDLRNRNILVSAAAGSGKTAVLVERIITRLTKDESPIDVDQLLIVTYTEAAASEMKERIRNAIEKALEERPDDVHLQRQSTLVHHAQVTTIHSFCLSVIRDYFHTIDLDPGFRIGEEGELKLLKRDVLEELLEACYTEGKPEFLNFVESFASGKDDKKLEEIILQLYEYSRSYPNPETWLDTCAARYDVETVEALTQAPFVAVIMKDIQNLLKDLEESLIFAQEICREENGPAAYLNTLESDLNVILGLQSAKTFAEMEQKFSELKWERLATNRDKTVAEEKIEIVKSIREECKKTVSAIGEDYFFDSIEELQKDMLAAKLNMGVLADLVKEFANAYRSKKQSKNMIDFSDMEHYALQILTEEVDGEFVPSAVAEEYQEKFLEVMIDEYQDSNLIQEAILTSVSTVSKGKYNVFMVGDVKQSIYRFRLSRPELFMEKYRTYSSEDGPQQKIDLHKNFRSRREVLDSTNFIFEQIMTKGFGGIAYDQRAALYVGASYEERPGNETEVCFVDASELSQEENARELEAKAVAREIKKLVGKHEVLDKETGEYRKANYSDIVILVRSLKGWADVFLRTLGQEGVPAYSGSKEGYFETREIQMMLDYLRILDNPRQDIPFAAVLTSPFVGLTSEELALIQSGCKGKNFYERACAYAGFGNVTPAEGGACAEHSDAVCVEEEKNAGLKKKLQVFLAQYETFRKKVPYTAIHTLLWDIMDETGYGNYIAALPGGEQRAANLEMLIEKAISFESTSYKGLFHFVRYIEQLHKYDVDYGEANVIEESTDVVRLMSIHKSKGLEFPIVFVVGMDKQFNMQDARASIVIHPELGVGLDAIDLEYRTKAPTLLKRMIQKEVQKESVAEELRILYVAMTRAKEKLILMGTVSNMEAQLYNCIRLRNHKETALPYTRLVKAKKYFDWVIPALYRNQTLAETLNRFQIDVPFQNPLYFKQVPFDVKWIGQDELILEDIEEAFAGNVTKQILQMWDTEVIYDKNVKKQVEEQFAFFYPYTLEAKTKQKVSVSELKKKAYMEEEEIEEEVVIPLFPKFLQQEAELTGASRGTAYHRVLELLNFAEEYDAQTLQEAIREMTVKELLSEEMAACVAADELLKFLQSSIGRRVQKACQRNQFHAEQPFVLAEKLGEDRNYPDEVTLIQGIIDVYFEEDGELVVLDYKTDRVKRAEELIDKYKVQLEYYAKALEQVTKKPVKEKIIYSFTLQQEIEV